MNSLVRSPKSGWLESAANAALLVASLCVVWVVLLGNPFRRPPELPTYRVGEKFDSLIKAGSDSTGPRPTLVVAMTEACRYCQASLPFYRKLTEAINSAGASAATLLIVSTDSESDLVAYLGLNGIKSARVVNVKPGQLKIPVTPMVFLLDSDGEVRKVWAGKLTEAEERAVMASLKVSPTP